MQQTERSDAKRTYSLMTWLKRWWTPLLALVLCELAFLHASSLMWMCDDAYVSIRYADNWINGLGLVYNAGERVEGITNPLWTVILGIAGFAGFNLEKSAQALGIGAYLATTLLLLSTGRARGGLRDATGRYLPFAALVVLADPDLATFATGGLETSAFTASVLASFVLAWLPNNVVVAAVLAGSFGAISGMLRPDGMLLLPALALAFGFPQRRRGLLAFCLACLPLLLLFHGWRRWYYGDWLPNTYYAKSAFLSWWSQGAIYLGYFLQRRVVLFGVAAVGSVLLVLRALRGSASMVPNSAHGLEPWWNQRALQQLLVAWAMIFVYTLSVVRVGGDFMYARLLLPTLPLIAITAELSLSELLRFRVRVYWVIAFVSAGALFIAPCPVGRDIEAHHGIVDERECYRPEFLEAAEGLAGILRECVKGFPVRVAIYGGDLRLAYRARFAYVVEASAGLTDAILARRRLYERKRVGHEKIADASHLVLARRAHFTISPLYSTLSDPNGYIPEVYAKLCGLDVRLLHWDPAFVEYFRARGSLVPDYPAQLDQLIKRVDFESDAWVQRQWAMAQHFYFAHVSDPTRAQVFEARLRRSRDGATPSKAK